MLKMGWILNDEFLWIKNNPTYTRGKRSVRNHEPIFHWVKSDDFFYNDNWLKDITDKEDRISYGIDKKSPKLKSGMDYRDGVLETNVANTSELRKECKEEGFHLTHSATFPVRVPEICGLLSTKEGDTILDCFAGTSTVGKFALSNNRYFVGYEVNPEFIKASELNLRNLTFYERAKMSYGGRTFPSDVHYIGDESVEGSSIKEKNSPGFNRIKPVSDEHKKSFSNFTKAFNKCFIMINQMR
jgi:DNA modification methylase